MTVCDLENSTTRLGDLLRTFQNDICSKYQTFDLPSEEAARARRKAATAKKAGQTMTKPVTDKGKGTSSGSRKSRKFNLDTYKTHSLGGYAKAIRLFGSPDNYNSQTVSDRSCLLWKSHTTNYLQGELEHRRGKRFFKRVRKGKHVLGIGIQVRRERLIYRLQERNKQRQQAASNISTTNEDLLTVSFEEQEHLPPTLPTEHHHISNDTRQKIQLAQWLNNYRDDPAIQVCLLDPIMRKSLHFSRNSYPASRIIFCHGSFTTSMMVTNWTSLLLSAVTF